MALPNAYARYNNSKILTASPAELTLMLYEGAIKFCNIAIIGIEQNDIEKAHTKKGYPLWKAFFYNAGRNYSATTSTLMVALMSL